MYAKLAKNAAEHFVVRKETLPLPAALPRDLRLQRACYISIFENPGQRFRAAWGTPLPHYSSLAEEIIVNTTHAVKRKFRRADLPHLTYVVGVLGQLQRVSDVSHLDHERYGVYVRTESNKAALVLPRRIGVETAEDQIATAVREAGINPRRETPSLYRFTVTYYE